MAFAAPAEKRRPSQCPTPTQMGWRVRAGVRLDGPARPLTEPGGLVQFVLRTLTLISRVAVNVPVSCPLIAVPAFAKTLQAI